MEQKDLTVDSITNNQWVRTLQQAKKKGKPTKYETPTLDRHWMCIDYAQWWKQPFSDVNTPPRDLVFTAILVHVLKYFIVKHCYKILNYL